MNITMTLEGDSTERLVQTICATIGGAETAQAVVPAPEGTRAYKAAQKAEQMASKVPEPEAAPKAKPEPAAAPEPEPAPEPKAAPAKAQATDTGIDFGAVATAVRKVVNGGKATQKDVLAVFEAHGGKYLRDIDETEYPAVLAEIEAL